MYKLLITISLLFLLQAQSMTTTSHEEATSFSFYVFAAEWAGSVCETQNCNDDQGVSTNFWNIHGLWPSDGKMDVNYCSDEKFDPSSIASLSNELTLYWNGLYSSADAFHSHEWEKHGTCSGLNQIDYFSTVIQLAKTLDIYGALQNHGITPGGSYDCDQIAQAIKAEYNVNTFTLQADKGDISALELCIDKSFNTQDCPKGDICKGSVNYPVFK